MCKLFWLSDLWCWNDFANYLINWVVVSYTSWARISVVFVRPFYVLKSGGNKFKSRICFFVSPKRTTWSGALAKHLPNATGVPRTFWCLFYVLNPLDLWRNMKPLICAWQLHCSHFGHVWMTSWKLTWDHWLAHVLIMNILKLTWYSFIAFCRFSNHHHELYIHVAFTNDENFLDRSKRVFLFNVHEAIAFLSADSLLEVS